MLPKPELRFDECSPRGRINLRGDARIAGFRDRITATIGVGLPGECNISVTGPDCVVLWLGPDEWLIETPAEKEQATVRALEASLGDHHAAVTALGDASVTFRLGGPCAATVLAKGVTLDLDPRQFRAGSCARSRLARTSVLLHRPDDDLMYEITVPRSFADYARRWLEDAVMMCPEAWDTIESGQ